jgi:hypothetical protein
MNEHKLTREDRELIERHHDGDVGAEERAHAEALLAEHAEARAIVAALDEVHVAARAAEQAAWEDADHRAPADVARDASALADAVPSMGELAAMLERVHDDEAESFELEAVSAMRDERAEVAEYLSGLEVVRKGATAALEEATQDVDFSGFWGSLSARLELEEQEQEQEAAQVVAFPSRAKPSTAERPAFDVDEHRVMLYRYYDEEASADERAQVLAWAEIDPTVSVTLNALEELSFATKVAVEVAEERQDLSRIWSGVAAEIGAETNVVSLDRARERRDEPAASEPSTGWVARHHRELSVGLMAALVTIVGAWMFGAIGAPERVIVEKTVVIVDSVESESTASVMVSGPMQPASLDLDAQDDEAAEAETTPTIIWLIDPEEPAQGDEAAEQPAETDAPDAGSTNLGKPI